MPLATGTCALVFLYNKRHDFIIHVLAICFISIINTWLYLTHSQKIITLINWNIKNFYLKILHNIVQSVHNSGFLQHHLQNVAHNLLCEKSTILKAQYKWHLCSFCTYTCTSLCTGVIHTYQITDLSSTKQREGATVTSVFNKSYWSN